MAPPPAPNNELKLPHYTADFRNLSSTLKYAGFCAQMDTLNSNSKPIGRPLMEEQWVQLYTEKASVAEKKMPAFTAAVGQIRGHAGFDVEKYWTEKGRKAAEKGVRINTKAGNAEGKSTQ